MSSIKENKIKEILCNVDFTSDWDVNIIISEIKDEIGESVALDFKWTKNVSVNETNSEVIVTNDVESIDVVFTDIDNIIKKITVKVGRV